MKVYVIRHGQTDVNLQGLINSRNDEDLNDTGVRQAEEMGRMMEGRDYGLVIASPMLRTVHTARLVNRAGVPLITDPALMERDFGPYTKAPVDSLDRNDMWRMEPEHELEGAESVKDMLERVTAFLDGLPAAYPGTDIVLVTHGGTSKAISCYFSGMPADRNLAAFRHGNREIHEFTYPATE